jgi:dolichol-phosphate mannosyltransferase
MKRKVYVILPVYNEGKSIYDLLCVFRDFFAEQPALLAELIVVNDCSKDDSEAWIDRACQECTALPVQYVKHEVNQGLGGALHTGFSRLHGVNANDIVATMDGDNTHNPFLLADMISKIKQGADMVIASRYCEQSHVHGLGRWRSLLSEGARHLYAVRWHIAGVRDYTCGYRAYCGSLIQKYLSRYGDLMIQERGFTATTEILKKMSLFSPAIVEVPMILRYDNKMAASHMKILKTIKATLRILWKG